MRNSIQLILMILCGLAAIGCGTVRGTRSQAQGQPLRLLYWNIQNGMWDGQDDNYDRFVNWVKTQDPDVCVWAEASSIYYPKTAKHMAKEEKYLPEHWDELAARYGHQYVFLGGWRDNYPQVITSKYPIEGMDRIIGNGKDSIVSHGAGWARIQMGDKPVNIVTLHTWPQAWAMNVTTEDRERSKAAHEGDKYRRMEVEYICRHTILTSASPDKEYWMMMGDFNSMSRKDNWFHHFPENDTRLLVHDYILSATPYVDIIAERYPGKHFTTTGGEARIDFVYATRPLYHCIKEARILTDDYTEPVRDPMNLSNFWRPSDHRPILVDFEFTR